MSDQHVTKIEERDGRVIGSCSCGKWRYEAANTGRAKIAARMAAQLHRVLLVAEDLAK